MHFEVTFWIGDALKIVGDTEVVKDFTVMIKKIVAMLILYIQTNVTEAAFDTYDLEFRSWINTEKMSRNVIDIFILRRLPTDLITILNNGKVWILSRNQLAL